MVIQCYQGSFVIVLICRHVSDLCELPIGIQNMQFTTSVDLKSDLISKVISLEGDNFVAIYYLRGSEIWPDDKTGGL
jgi:hypothetical protein